LLDVDELPGSADADAAPDHELAELQRAFLSSPWAERSPVEVEAAFELTVAGLLVRGRADAVFATADDGLDVVDWKTGPPPRDPEEQSVRSVQLAAYRLAYSRLRGVPLEQVTAAFHHVREGVTVRPVDLLDAGALERLVRSVPAATA
jgi:DNA helicase-2/ATP-dependent DNA helicase PcrA